MFERDYFFRGKHAIYVEELKERVINKEKGGLFSSFMEIFLVAPLIGYLDNRRSPIDKSQIYEKKIFKTEMDKISEELIFIYKLITINDKKVEKALSKRIEKAFKDLEKDDFEIFEEYLRGGIEILYENLYFKNIALINQSTKILDFFEKFECLKNINNIDVTNIK